ncbi:GDSL-type esterase/lipase family protein [Crocinitomicaceae bacterium]|nr:GDSL-type esterase/lipase family protein [Crocinitomicaceae bacterium]
MRFALIILLGQFLTPCWAQEEPVAYDTVMIDTTSWDGALNTYVFPDFREFDTAARSDYPFVEFEKNNYEFYTENSPNFEVLYQKTKRLRDKKEGTINMYHIGGSHLQADIYTHDIREHLQNRWTGVPGERAWVFPFDLAGTNNPWNYEFSSPNDWHAYRCIPHRPSKYDIDYGVLGAAVTCPDSVISVKFEYDYTENRPPISHVRVFHNKGEFPYWMHFGANELLRTKTEHNPELGYTDVWFSDGADTLNIQFARTGPEAPELELYGFVLMNDKPGISYTAIGINGAGLYTYLANIRFEEQLKTYPPDFFAFSVGTNDGNVPYDKFKPSIYKANLEKVMQMVLRANPDCALLLTVPNDSYYRRYYLNKNIARERDMIIELAQEYEMAVWDLYGLMGGLGSSKTWKNNKLMKRDLIHFTPDGYHFKGDLYLDAFMKFMDQMEKRELLMKSN